MTDERWKDVVGKIKEQFTVVEEGEQELPEDPGVVSFIIFERAPGVQLKIERTVRPIVVGKKTIGSRRIGSETTVEYEYDPNETTSFVKAYTWNDAREAWDPFDAQGAFFS